MKFYLPLISSLLLILAFPRFEIWILAWIGLVPLLLALEGVSPRRAYVLGYLCGVGFFAGTLYWFIHVTLVGAVLLILYLANYFALFALGYVRFKPRRLWQSLLFYPSLWVGLEFLRDRLFTGFGWGSLGYSQYKFLPIIQIADITGMLGVSFLIVMVNVLGKAIISEGMSRGSKATLKNNRGALAAVGSVIIVVLLYGWFWLRPASSARKADIMVVQGNVAQEIKWEPEEWPRIMQKYLVLTQEAVRQNPDLIVWPETAFPGYIWEAPEIFQELKDFVKDMRTPLLLGLVTKQEGYFNSALLISSAGEVVKQYDKLHLVPFGEYIPLRKWLPLVADFLPIEDFTPGQEYTLFPIRRTERSARAEPLGFYSVLICFEDTISGIARGFVLRGAHLLMNITNDAWFKDTNSPFLHLQGSVFRSVENRRVLVRAANTGVSCFIDRTGKIYQRIRDARGKATYVAGYQKAQVALYDGLSFYTKFGDIFAYLCIAYLLYGMRFFKV